MVTGVLFLMVVLLALVLAAFIYQIVTRPVAAVDAPTLLKSAAVPPAPAPALPAGQPHAPASHAATKPVPWSSPPGGSGGPRSGGVTALMIAALAAVIIGGWLAFQIAPTGTACSHHLAVEVCSQGLVLFTGAQLAGAVMVVAGLGVVVIVMARGTR